MSDADPEDAGLASGIVNTSFMMGGALGLAILASLASSRTSSLEAAGDGRLQALTGGYHVAFVAGAVASAAAAVLSALVLRNAAAEAPAHHAHEHVGEPAAETE